MWLNLVNHFCNHHLLMILIALVVMHICKVYWTGANGAPYHRALPSHRRANLHLALNLTRERANQREKWFFYMHNSLSNLLQKHEN